MGQACSSSSCTPSCLRGDNDGNGAVVANDGALITVVKQLEDGSTYRGETKDGLVRHGQGLYTYPDGKTFFEGGWHDGKAHGEGTFRDAESEYF